MKRHLSLFLVSIISYSSVIQASSFEGFAAAFGLAGVGSSIEYRNTYPVDMNFSNTNVVGLVDFSYSTNIYQPWFIGLGGTYDLNRTKTKGINPYDYSVRNHGVATVKMKYHSSAYAQGTYEYSDKGGIFAKLSYHMVTTDLDNSKACLIDCGYGNYTNRHHGVGYSLGFINFFENVFLKSELQMVHYISKSFSDSDGAGYISTIKPETVSGILSLGYRF